MLGRFVQADTIVPDPYNPVDYDRYSYSRNNPVNYNDPSGHCAFVVGAGFGALFGGIVYGITTLVSGRSFNAGDLATSIAVGAAGGALVGTGVGAGSGIAMLASIGADTGILSSELAYEVTSGNQFTSGELLATSLVGAATGAATGVLGIPGINPAVATGGKIAVNALAGAADYSLRSVVNEQDINAGGLLASSIIGGVAGVVGELLPSIKSIGGSRTERLYAEEMDRIYNNAYLKPDNMVRQGQRDVLARNFVANGVVDDFVRGAGINIVLSPLQNYFGYVLSQ